MKTLFTSLFIMLFIASGFAQQQRGERIKAMKTAFITQELELTPAEAERFWPVYNRFEKDLRALKRQEREQMRNSFGDNAKNISDAQAKEILEKLNRIRTQEVELHQQREQEILRHIDASKVLRLRKAEHDFQVELLKKYRGGNKK